MSTKIKSKNSSSKNFSSPQRSYCNTTSPQRPSADKSKNFSPTRYNRGGDSRSSQRIMQTASFGADAGFTQTREQMIQRYYELADQYRAELQRRDELHKEQQKVQAEIASIFIQGDRIDELIKKVKETQQPEAPDE